MRGQNIILAFLMLLTPVSLAQSSGGEFGITRSVISAGGGTSSGGEFSITGTIGQAGTDLSLGGSFSIRGGFQVSGDGPGLVFLDSFEG